MEQHKVIVGEFENKLYAEIARRDLIAAGISANICKERDTMSSSFYSIDKGVRLVVSDSQVEEAKKVLQKKFI